MIYVNKTVKKWLNKYPPLRESLPLCECSVETLKPFSTKNSVGLTCIKCSTYVWIRKKHKDNIELVDLLLGKNN